jgi:hypothetical protein
VVLLDFVANLVLEPDFVKNFHSYLIS